ncbi:MAG: rhomboid family intramembrane serine protease [Vagococcus sp.]|uniref:rhomboid family intramembrane serine protease n=1 Tax=Vagococcus sp. TaxID=1933889 RepID=UPI002FC862E8
MNQFSSKWQRINRSPFLMYLFLGIQVIVFLGMELMGAKNGVLNGSENSAILYLFGAMSPQAIIQNHEYWRFVTPIFVHIGLTHLALNSLSLYFVGRILEPIIGHVRFFILYILSGIIGNLLSFAFGSSYGLSAGASTSLFGIFAAFIVLGKIYRYHPLIQQMSQSMTLLIIINLVMNIFDSGVDILGHIGGALGGVLLMIVLGVPRNNLQEKMNVHKRIAAAIFTVFIIIFCLVYGFTFG